MKSIREAIMGKNKNKTFTILRDDAKYQMLLEFSQDGSQARLTNLAPEKRIPVSLVATALLITRDQIVSEVALQTAQQKSVEPRPEPTQHPMVIQ